MSCSWSDDKVIESLLEKNQKENFEKRERKFDFFQFLLSWKFFLLFFEIFCFGKFLEKKRKVKKRKKVKKSVCKQVISYCRGQTPRFLVTDQRCYLLYRANLTLKTPIIRRLQSGKGKLLARGFRKEKGLFAPVPRILQWGTCIAPSTTARTGFGNTSIWAKISFA